MKITLSGIEYDTADSLLAAMEQRLRTGQPSEDSLERHIKIIWEGISFLKKELPRRSGLLDVTGQLKLKKLEAEYHQENGHPNRSIEALKDVWQELGRFVTGDDVGAKLKELGNRELTRQRIWALMLYVFYKFYIVDGLHQKALGYFLKMEKLIESQLKTKTYEPNGTLAMVHYLQGLCYRGLTSYTEAERHFLQAQKEINARFEDKKKTMARDSLERERLNKGIFSARICSGLGWVAIHQGKLTEAQLLFEVANSFIASSAQQSLKLFIKTLNAMAMRRLAAYESDEYNTAMGLLLKCHAEYETLSVPSQVNRCAAEVLRGFLDLAEFGKAELLKLNLRNATEWLAKLEKGSQERKDEFRCFLYRSRLLIIQGNTEAALKVLRNAKLAENKESVRLGISILETVLYINEKDGDNALECLDEQGKKYRSDDNNRASGWHPVLEAERSLLLCQAYLLKQDLEASQIHMRNWRTIAPFVENHYLHHLARSLEQTSAKMAFRVEYNFPIFHPGTRKLIKEEAIKDQMQQFKHWLASSIYNRYPNLSKSEVEKIFGSTSTWQRLRRTLEGNIRQKQGTSHRKPHK